MVLIRLAQLQLSGREGIKVYTTRAQRRVLAVTGIISINITFPQATIRWYSNVILIFCAIIILRYSYTMDVVCADRPSFASHTNQYPDQEDSRGESWMDQL